MQRAPEVLLVDDEEANRLILGRRLEREGYRVTAAENGARALALLRARHFDLVLLDWQMPEMDGLATLEAMKSDDALKDLPVIMLTAETARDSVQLFLARGAAGHLAKPVDAATLGQCLHRWLCSDVAGEPASAAPQAEPPGATGEGDEVIDWAALVAQFNDRQAFIRKLLAAALDAHAGTPARLREAAACGDWETLAFLAHGLKGIGGNMKARRVHELAAHTEASARGRHPETADLAVRLADAVQAMIAALRSRLEDPPDGCGRMDDYD